MKRVYESYPDFKGLDLPDVLEYLEEAVLLCPLEWVEENLELIRIVKCEIRNKKINELWKKEN